jgi:BirA family biotin operon repressor/biotin-[acetyl-CoA-carboxylase] ligase
MAPADAAQLSFVAALAVRDLACRFVPEALVRLKWPNDVLLAEEKLAGILIESGRRNDGALWLAAGIGVNLASAPSGTERPATSLASHLKAGVPAAPTPEDALELLASALASRIAAWTKSGFGPVREAWLEAAFGMGRPCVAHLGHQTVTGVAEDLDVDGALVLRLEDGSLSRITAGDVFFGGS